MNKLDEQVEARMSRETENIKRNAHSGASAYIVLSFVMLVMFVVDTVMGKPWNLRDFEIGIVFMIVCGVWQKSLEIRHEEYIALLRRAIRIDILMEQTLERVDELEVDLRENRKTQPHPTRVLPLPQ